MRVGEAASRVRFFGASATMDADINRWLDEEGVVLDQLLPVEGGILVRFSPAEKVSKGSKVGPPVPLIEKAIAPTVDVVRKFTDGARPAQAMAGIFGVTEGSKLSMEDSDLAPVPVFSPDFDIKAYADFFGNVSPL